MRRWGLLFGLLLLAPLAARAEGLVSMAELRDEARGLARWQGAYEARGETVRVDAPLTVPDAERMPILRVRAWIPFDSERLQSEGLTEEGVNGWFRYLDPVASAVAGGASAAPDGPALLQIADNTGTGAVYNAAMLHASDHPASALRTHGVTLAREGYYPGELDPLVPLAQDNPATLQDATRCLEALLERYYPGGETKCCLEYVEIRSRSVTSSGGDGAPQYAEDYPMGTIFISFRPCLAGIPVYACAAERETADDSAQASQAAAAAREKMEPLAWGVSYNHFEYMSGERFDLSAAWLQRAETVEADVPLLNLTDVLRVLGEAVSGGCVRQVYALRLGYCLFLNESSPDTFTLFPVWFCDCDYADGAERAPSGPSSGEGALSGPRDRPAFTRLMVNAQTGELYPAHLTDARELYCPDILRRPGAGRAAETAETAQTPRTPAKSPVILTW